MTNDEGLRLQAQMLTHSQLLNFVKTPTLSGPVKCVPRSIFYMMDLIGISADSYSKLEPPFFGSALHSRTCDVIFSNVSCWDTRTSSDRQKISPAQQTRTSSGVPAANIGKDDVICLAV